MPFYSYTCEFCNHNFEVKKSIDKSADIPKCPECHSKKSVYRDYLADNISVAEAPKTLGSLADKNSGKISSDEKAHIQSKIPYRSEHPNLYNPEKK